MDFNIASCEVHGVCAIFKYLASKYFKERQKENKRVQKNKRMLHSKKKMYA